MTIARTTATALASVLLATGCSQDTPPSADRRLSDSSPASLTPDSTTTHADPVDTAADAIGSDATPPEATPGIVDSITTTAPARPASSSPTEGCRTEQRSGGNVQLSDESAGGIGWEEFPSCSYTATVAGGYRARGSWSIEITRGDTRLTIDSRDAPGCGSGVIRAGDEVRAVLRKGANSPEDWFIAVGARQSC